MNRGRRNLNQSASEQDFTLEQCQSIAHDQTERMDDAKGDKSLTLFKPKERRLNRAYNMGFFWGQAVTQRRRKRRRRREGRDMCEIPLELVIEILIRLSVKSLTRFKCVSKQWSSLISSRYFCDRVFTVTRRQQPCLYMCLVEKDGQRLLLSLSSTSSLDKTCFVVGDQDLSIPGMGGFFLNVFRGLMCFSRRKKACIYNPSTKQLLTLPAIKSDMIVEQGEEKHHIEYYIGHDPFNDQYKLFCTIVITSNMLTIIKSEHWVLLLESGGSWKKVVPLESNCPHHAPFTRAINGSVIHYMAWLDMYTCVFVSFDIKSEELTTIPVPPEVGNMPLPAIMIKADLIEYGEKLAIFDHSYLREEGYVDFWILEDAGKKEWSNQTLFLQPCQRHLVHEIDLMVKGTTQDGKVILVPLDLPCRFYILCYDIQFNDLTKVEIKGIPQLWFDKPCYFDLTFMCESESFIYLET